MPLQRRPHGSGDAWVEGPDGRRFWGTYGAAGLLVARHDDGVLLQHRAEWSHFGGTWGLPGGARHQGESARDGAVREATEEAGVPAPDVRPRFLSLLDLGWWSYSTVVAGADAPFTPVLVKLKLLPLKHWLADCVKVEVGCGLTVIVYVTGVPVHPDKLGVTVIVPVIGEEPLLAAVNVGTVVVPDAARPMPVLEFVHA